MKVFCGTILTTIRGGGVHNLSGEIPRLCFRLGVQDDIAEFISKWLLAQVRRRFDEIQAKKEIVRYLFCISV